MLEHYLPQILKHGLTSYVVFDQNLNLTDFDLKHTVYLDKKNVSKFQSNLWDIFPELIGSEERITELFGGKKKSFKLENINKPDTSGKIRYFNLTFLIGILLSPSSLAFNLIHKLISSY